MRRLSEARRVGSRRGPDPHRARKGRRRSTREERKPEARPHPPGRAAEGTESDAGPPGRVGIRGPGPGGSEPDTAPQRGRGREFSAVTSRISDRSGSLAHSDACRALIEGRPSTRVPVRYPAPAK